MLEAKLKWSGGLKFDGTSAYGLPISADGAKVAGGGEQGYKPTELVMFGLAGCTGMDVVKILEKMRQNLTGLEIEVKAFQPEQYPKPFHKIEVKYILRGKNLDRNKVEQAITLSEEKYCAVSLTLKGVANIKTSIEIIEE
ncbi:MAG: osmotically inducible protein OsmC [candidate division Zixibacteria bacterium HGW-Zixibacteria-1]|nr:MAG: osmotically inducible protein OsmC [candidate division Zixibacteria bacterium HGW-Zixibacteria-1]